MPTLTDQRLPWKAVVQIRNEITLLLLAKGLKEGHGKWGGVFARHLRKRENAYNGY
jgi:hypothetical protein